MKKLVILGLSASLFLGCVPKMHTVLPQISGRVVDAVSGKPLGGVEVGSAQTNPKGRFVIEGKKELGIGTPMGGVWRLPTILVPVSKKGYRNIYCKCSGLSNNIYVCTDVTIALLPSNTKVISEVIKKSTQNDFFSCETIITKNR